MERLLFLVDQGGVNKGAFDLACYLAKTTKSPLTGLFIDVTTADKGVQLTSGKALSVKETDLDSKSNLQNSLMERERAFGLSCSNKGIRWLTIEWPVRDIGSIIEETRFADLLIVSSEASLKRNMESPSIGILTEILGKSECPVIVCPTDFQFIEEIVFAYDGSRSSMFAVKQFTHLFPELSGLKVILLQVVPAKDEYEITAEKEVDEYLKMHYFQIACHALPGDNPGDELSSYLTGRANALIVMGAYGRSAVSMTFKKSTSALLLETGRSPIFISHR